MILKSGVLLAVAAGCCWAQVSPPQRPQPSLSPPLKQYLGLTDAQADAIVKINLGYDQVLSMKSQRMAQVQIEIGEETRREPLDPIEIGRRYVELEVIRRELQDELTRTRAAALQVLNDSQRTRLKALEEVLTQTAVALDAQCASLLAPPQQEALPSAFFIRTIVPSQPLPSRSYQLPTPGGGMTSGSCSFSGFTTGNFLLQEQPGRAPSAQ